MVDLLEKSLIRPQREPYEIIIEKNFMSRAKRMADDTRDELSKVLKRVENVICLNIYIELF